MMFKYISDINRIPCQAIHFRQMNAFKSIGEESTTAYILILSNKTELLDFLIQTVSFG